MSLSKVGLSVWYDAPAIGFTSELVNGDGYVVVSLAGLPDQRMVECNIRVVNANGGNFAGMGADQKGPGNPMRLTILPSTNLNNVTKVPDGVWPQNVTGPGWIPIDVPFTARNGSSTSATLYFKYGYLAGLEAIYMRVAGPLLPDNLASVGLHIYCVTATDPNVKPVKP
jgi:hypothetical protein